MAAEMVAGRFVMWMLSFCEQQRPLRAGFFLLSLLSEAPGVHSRLEWDSWVILQSRHSLRHTAEPACTDAGMHWRRHAPTQACTTAAAGCTEEHSPTNCFTGVFMYFFSTVAAIFVVSVWWLNPDLLTCSCYACCYWLGATHSLPKGCSLSRNVQNKKKDKK